MTAENGRYLKGNPEILKMDVQSKVEVINRPVCAYALHMPCHYTARKDTVIHGEVPI
jgi:hypothetical protein